MLGLGSGLQGTVPTDSIAPASVAAKLVDATVKTWVLLHLICIKNGIQWH